MAKMSVKFVFPWQVLIQSSLNFVWLWILCMAVTCMAVDVWLLLVWLWMYGCYLYGYGCMAVTCMAMDVWLLLVWLWMYGCYLYGYGYGRNASCNRSVYWREIVDALSYARSLCHGRRQFPHKLCSAQHIDTFPRQGIYVMAEDSPHINYAAHSTSTYLLGKEPMS